MCNAFVPFCDVAVVAAIVLIVVAEWIFVASQVRGAHSYFITYACHFKLNALNFN